MRYQEMLVLALTSIAMADEAPHQTSSQGSFDKPPLTLDSTSPRLTAPPKVRFERDLESFLSSIAEIADKANEKGSSLLDRGETLVKDKASTIGTAFDGTETLIAGKLDEVKSRVLSAMSEYVTHISEPGDGGRDSDNGAASLDVRRSVGAAAAVLCAIFIGFIAT
ncbi:hypothetical protein Forpi1262_v015505 [Fusarium oxysporum f. sp. raphani]|uniref:Uncharacterized protein n=1 Tax=Fusarium oxysporum f. sp. raphani TaxID=96318 RepID=A0A8J5NRZ3_FUSOX|nr:hypothetical protein Forpi1262_v018382 [Fusarium oxysporum f. sp. raphani]KAG7423372.1 hypothetical protein Forpi1262_v015505 [Fusarium oxysporum f. sp. raphani]